MREAEGSVATIALVGTDEALMEGLAQSLVAGGHRVHLSSTIADVSQFPAADMVVVERGLVGSGGEGLRRAIARGAGLVLYRANGDDATMLPPSIHRLTLADLQLPLEKNRLLALVKVGTGGWRGRGPMADRPDPSPDASAS